MEESDNGLDLGRAIRRSGTAAACGRFARRQDLEPVEGIRRPPPLLKLELLGEQHLGGVAELLEDPDVQRYTMVPVPVPEISSASGSSATRRGGRRARARPSRSWTTTARFWAALAFAIDREGRELELGYTVTPAARGRGAATWALRALTEWAVRQLDPARIQLQISADNAAVEDALPSGPATSTKGRFAPFHSSRAIRQDSECGRGSAAIARRRAKGRRAWVQRLSRSCQ
jgi:GNAT superfamily N-acetyltransferase